MVAGERKDVGNPLRELTPLERTILQEKIDILHDYFLNDVINSRKLNEEQIEVVKTAEFFMGVTGKELGLVDEFGGKDEAVEYIEKIIEEEAVLAEYKERRTLLDVFGGMMNERSFFVGKGIGSALFGQTNRINIIT